MSSVNAPLPHQLTVRQLRAALESAQDEAVVGIVIPPGFQGHELLALHFNLRVRVSTRSPVVTMLINESEEPAIDDTIDR